MQEGFILESAIATDLILPSPTKSLAMYEIGYFYHQLLYEDAPNIFEDSEDVVKLRNEVNVSHVTLQRCHNFSSLFNVTIFRLEQLLYAVIIWMDKELVVIQYLDRKSVV